ncbi:hypothetical protein GCG54_00012292 [Colletotrichum gloeosporioides]|uniref:Uncharacterized protein n=1 Tax=Colletotrichum gloeosporioides TaxID=474922 RepID=A0A8H4CDJ7_COLGL|nr:uncharacterized protein GCG54_00012292 [Colletotrichum gloeosporioides]KAF3802048.1 hypothetical protein GCG54_00012292 [Colletotrichum gloeosporioides]
MSFPLFEYARKPSKAELDDLIRETKVKDIKGSSYGLLAYADKITRKQDYFIIPLLKFTRLYLLKAVTDEDDLRRLYGLEIDMDMVEATDNDPNACEYLTSFLEIAKAA